MSDEKYEVRLYRIEGEGESLVEATEVPIDRLQTDQQVSELPDREAMSLINANVAAPINLALALNALSDNSVAVANAQQIAPINQGI